MDLVRGGSVQTLLGDHGPLPESYVAVVLDQTLQALEAIHAAGVVHRDIKPANLLLEADRHRPPVRPASATSASPPWSTTCASPGSPAPIGTDGYMAPEQVRGAAPDPRQDLYAAGVVAVQMLTGRSDRPGPRHAGRTGACAAARRRSPAPTRSAVPAAAAALARLGVPGRALASDDRRPARRARPARRRRGARPARPATRAAIACFAGRRCSSAGSRCSSLVR